MLDALLNAFVTLFVTVDPIGTAPLFLGLTAGMAAADRRAVALRGALTATAVLALFALTGTVILDAMGITIDAFRVAGGLLLFVTAFEMIYARRQERKEATSRSAVREHIANLAVFPLTIPLLAGPGAISATVLLASELGSSAGTDVWLGRLALLGVIATLMVVTFAVLAAAERLDKRLGNVGRAVLTRLFGVLLAALSVQYVADGVRGLIEEGASASAVGARAVVAVDTRTVAVPDEVPRGEASRAVEAALERVEIDEGRCVRRGRA